MKVCNTGKILHDDLGRFCLSRAALSRNDYRLVRRREGTASIRIQVPIVIIVVVIVIAAVGSTAKSQTLLHQLDVSIVSDFEQVGW